VAAFGDEDVGGLDVAMNDALGVSGFESVGNFDGVIQNLAGKQRLFVDEMFESVAIEKLHGDEGTALVFANFIDGANVGVIEGGSGVGFAFETKQ